MIADKFFLITSSLAFGVMAFIVSLTQTNTLLAIILGAGVFGTASLASTMYLALYNMNEDRKYRAEKEAFAHKAAALGYDAEELQSAKYEIRDHLVTHRGLTTEQLLSQVSTGSVFNEKNLKEVEQGLAVAGFFGICRFGQDSDGYWWAIRDSEEVRQSYRQYQRKALTTISA